MPLIAALERLRQEYCHKFEINLLSSIQVTLMYRV